MKYKTQKAVLKLVDKFPWWQNKNILKLADCKINKPKTVKKVKDLLKKNWIYKCQVNMTD